MSESKKSDVPQPKPVPHVARRLPIVTIKGREYFVDERLQEYRAVDNPHIRIPFGE